MAGGCFVLFGWARWDREYNGFVYLEFFFLHVLLAIIDTAITINICVSEGFQPLSSKVRSPSNQRPGQIAYLVCGSTPFVCGSGNTDGEWLCLEARNA